MKNLWTPEEISYLLESCTTDSIDNIAVHLNRTPKAVRRKMEKLDLTTNRLTDWTPEEELLLKEGYLNGKHAKDFLSIFPTRSRDAIKGKMSRMGLYATESDIIE